MELAMDLKEYCPYETIEEAIRLCRAQGIASPTFVQDMDGTWLMKGKVLDAFNFVSHPRIRADETGSRLQDFGCDCLESRKQRGMCVHCAALYLTWKGEIPVNYVPVPRESNKAASAEIAVAQTVKQDALVKTAVMPKRNTTEKKTSVDYITIPESASEEKQGDQVIRSMEIILGEDEQGNSALWCPNDTERVFHTNVGIIGTMGTGKTQFAKSLLTQLYWNRQKNYDGYPLGILIFDYKGDYNETKRDFVDATNARVLKPYKLPYNPLALNPGNAYKPLLPTHTANEFKDTISQIYNLGPKQQHLLLEAIIQAYQMQGIDPANPMTWNRRAPTIEQVYRIVADKMKDRSVDKLMTAMDKLHQFCLFEDDPNKAVSLDQLLNGVVVIDISGYDSDIQSTVVAITLNQFYARMHAQGSSPTDGRYRQLRKFILVDEADTFMGEKLPSLRRIMKEGREFGVGVILSTQSLQHYVSNEDDYSRYVLTWVVHNVGDLKQRDVEYLFRLPTKSQEGTDCYAAIKKLQKHESVVKLGNDAPIAIRNKAFYQLYQQMQG